MADVGYFDSVSANLKTGVGAQVKGISEGVKANSDAGVSPSVNALNTGVKAAAAIGGLADGLSEAAMLPVLGAMGKFIFLLIRCFISEQATFGPFFG